MTIDASGEREISPEPKPTRLTGVVIDFTNPTARLLATEIQMYGKIPFSRFMDLSLFGPDGYYSKGKAKIGHEGDFVTHSKIEAFNVCVGRSLLNVWRAMGEPKKGFRIVEMGAGSGAMAKDILKWAKKSHPKFYKALSYVIVEYGDLIAKQKETIAQAMIAEQQSRGRQKMRIPFFKRDTSYLEKIQWIQGSALDLPLRNIEGVIVSNELPDAFPVEVVKRIDGKIKQKFITIQDNEWVEVWDDVTNDVDYYIAHYGVEIQEDIEEPINLNAVQWQLNVLRALKKGAVITIDYGANGPVGPYNASATRTFPKASDKNEYNDPGNVDITSDVNFSVLERVANEAGLSTAFTGTEGEYLLQHGLNDFYTVVLHKAIRSRSLSELCHPDLLQYLILMNQGFLTQVFVEGMRLPELPVYPPLLPQFNDIFIVKIAPPNSTLTIEYGSHGETSQTSTITTNDKGAISLLANNIDPRDFFAGENTCIIRDGSQVIFDNSDVNNRKRVAQDSGLRYDLSF